MDREDCASFPITTRAIAQPFAGGQMMALRMLGGVMVLVLQDDGRFALVAQEDGTLFGAQQYESHIPAEARDDPGRTSEPLLLV